MNKLTPEELAAAVNVARTCAGGTGTVSLPPPVQKGLARAVDQLADELGEARLDLKTAREECDYLLSQLRDYKDQARSYESGRKKLADRVRTLEDALRPFGFWSDRIDAKLRSDHPMRISTGNASFGLYVGDFRRAAAALGEEVSHAQE